MKKDFFIYILLLFTSFFVGSCTGDVYDYAQTNDRINKLDERILELEELCKQTNTNLASLRQIIENMSKNDMITSIVPVYKEDVLIGYTISFLYAEPITVYHGDGGLDGRDNDKVPNISIKQDTDGIYYWTIDGEWLLADSGERIEVDGALGADGNAGTDGITPRLKIEDGYWWVSLDNEQSWQQLMEAVVIDNTIFNDIVVEEENIVFYLKDGTIVKVPYYNAIKITFDLEENQTGIAAREVIKIPYKLSFATEHTFVYVTSSSNYTARIETQTPTTGIIWVTAPDTYEDGSINVHVENGNGYSSLQIINFYHQQMKFANGLEYVVPAEGGSVQVPLATNFNYSVEIPENAQAWCHLAQTRSVEFRNETLSFTFDANPEMADRKVVVDIIPENAETPLYQIVFIQSAAYFQTGQVRYAASAEGETINQTIRSSRGLKAVSNADWVLPTVELSYGTTYNLGMTVLPNNTGVYRSAEISLYSGDGKTLLGTIEVVQTTETSEEMKVMILQVVANPVNEHTVCIPLAGNVDCTIDWGDGTSQQVTGSHPMHTYSGLADDEVKYYTVRVKGSVTSLNANGIDNTYKNSITHIVQWGKLGLTNMYCAFKDYFNLRTVDADKTMCFTEVEDFSNCFYGCIRLHDLEANLFAYAFHAKNFNSAFYKCEALETLPQTLFNNCSKVESFDYTFFGCGKLTDIPNDLFSKCINVTSFGSTFQQCVKLETIPAGLFRNNLNAEYFYGVFYDCIGLRTIPQGLFINNSKVTDFTYSFYNCKSLTVLPADLFAGCPNVETFYGTFDLCSNIKDIPVNLLDKNRKVKNFGYMFSSCYQCKNESPYTIVNGVKYHLYERKNNPEEFIYPENSKYCFQSCSSMSDWSQIPSTWKYDY